MRLTCLVLAFLAFRVDGEGQPRFPAPGQKIFFVQRLHPCPLLQAVHPHRERIRM